MDKITTQPETDLKQETIFSEAFDYAPLQKSLKNARTWLFVIAGIQLIMGIVEYNAAETQTIGWLAFGIDAFIGLIFCALAFWSRKQPVIAFTIALSLYLLFNLSYIFLDASNLYRGILLKIIVVVALVKANRDARKYEAIKASVGERL